MFVHTRFSIRPLAIALALAVLAVVAAGLAAAPVDAGNKMEFDIRYVVKAENEAAAVAASLKIDGSYVGAVQAAGRQLHLVEHTVLIEEKDLAREAASGADDLTKEDGIAWAVPESRSVDEDRFYAWRFYAWPQGRQGEMSGTTGVADLIAERTSFGSATGAGVRIAVLDTGFDLDHPLLIDRLVPGVDLVDDDGRPSDLKNGTDDDGDGIVDEAHGHGTFVSGMLAQLSPGAEILPIRVLEADGSGELYDIIDGIDFAVASGADIINVSFGTSEESKALEDAVKRAQKAGVIIVASAGNGGNQEKQYPAAYSHVIAVAAFDEASNGVPIWGTYGDWVDVSAPGVDIVSSRPGGTMASWSGSSMSAPIVSAQVALMLETDRDKVIKEAEKLVRKSASKSNGNHRSKEGVVELGNIFFDVQ